MVLLLRQSARIDGTRAIHYVLQVAAENSCFYPGNRINPGWGGQLRDSARQEFRSSWQWLSIVVRLAP